LQNIKDKHAHQPAKTRETNYCIHVLPLEPPWLEKTNFQKCMYMPDVLSDVTK
jgi:hypothetical protein